MSVEIKELLKQMNGIKYGNLLDYIYMHRRDGSIGEKQFAKFLKAIGCNPIEVPGKIIELDYDNPGFRLGIYACSNAVIHWTRGDRKKFRICTPGWSYNDEQILPIEIIPVED